MQIRREKKSTTLYYLVVTEEEGGQGVPEAEEVAVWEGRDLVAETYLIWLGCNFEFIHFQVSKIAFFSWFFLREW